MREPRATAAAHPDGGFDRQAANYDARAGLPSAIGAAVAHAIVESAGVDVDDLVVELGAGTGEIGLHLARLPVRYVGLDNSRAMLETFRAKLDTDAPRLAIADCNLPWPLPDGRAALTFASRVIHLLDPAHAVQEAVRVGRPGGTLVLGRVHREPGGIKERMRLRRQQLLAEAGITPRRGEAGTRRVVELCVAAGGESLGRIEAAEWTGETTPAAILAAWLTLDRMGSVPVDRVTRDRIIAELRAWARVEFGSLERPETFRERYAIDIVRLPLLPRPAAIAERPCKTRS